MKIVHVLLMVTLLFTLVACKEMAKKVGDAGNSLGKTIDDTINRNKD